MDIDRVWDIVWAESRELQSQDSGLGPRAQTLLRHGPRVGTVGGGQKPQGRGRSLMNYYYYYHYHY